MDIKDCYASYSRHISHTYPDFLTRLGLDQPAERAHGALIIDTAGRSYLDCTAGYGLLNLGHNHPDVIEAIRHQLSLENPVTRPMISPIQARAGQKLASVLPDGLECVFMCNSGSEAADSAIKLARLTDRRKKIIAARGSFHGFTYGAISATGIPKLTNMFKPLVPGFEFVGFGDIAALEQAIDNDTCAILLEPIQHEAGVHIPPAGYFEQVRALCDKHNILLILDEVKTGFGKSGSLFAFQQFNDVIPDILVLGKSLGGGIIPSGAIVARAALWKKFSLSFGMSASSYGSNVLACAAAITTLEVIERDNLLGECRRKGERILSALQTLAAKYPDLLRGATGRGLLIGLKVINPALAFEISKTLVGHGIIILPAYADPSTLMIEPPLIITDEQIDYLLEKLVEILHGTSMDTAD